MATCRCFSANSSNNRGNCNPLWKLMNPKAVRVCEIFGKGEVAIEWLWRRRPSTAGPDGFATGAAATGARTGAATTVRSAPGGADLRCGRTCPADNHNILHFSREFSSIVLVDERPRPSPFPWPSNRAHRLPSSDSAKGSLRGREPNRAVNQNRLPRPRARESGQVDW